MLLYLVIIAVAIALFIYIKKTFKPLNLGSFTLVTGGVKTGKTTLSVHLVMREYKKALRSWKFSNFMYKLTKLQYFNIEKPLLYSNIPLKCEYVPLTLELLERKKRFAFGSIIYICEYSLVADSMSYKYVDNDALLLFNKLIGHETKGGKIFVDTQSVNDCHYALKRCLNSYLYIHKLVRWLPWFLVAYVRECRYSEDNSAIAVDTSDIDDSLKKVLIPKSVWKKFDCYCYSALTDNLPVITKTVDCSKSTDFKTDEIVTFKNGDLKNGKK